MQATVVNDFTKSLSIQETPRPVPGPGEVDVFADRDDAFNDDFDGTTPPIDDHPSPHFYVEVGSI